MGRNAGQADKTSGDVVSDEVHPVTAPAQIPGEARVRARLAAVIVESARHQDPWVTERAAPLIQWQG